MRLTDGTDVAAYVAESLPQLDSARRVFEDGRMETAYFSVILTEGREDRDWMSQVATVKTHVLLGSAIGSITGGVWRRS